MKIVVYDTKDKTHRFLKGKIGEDNCAWTVNKEDANDYTKKEFEMISKDFENNKNYSGFTSLGYTQ